MPTIAVVGLGYVGLPLAVAFGRRFDTIGYDRDAAKIDNYKRYTDPANEVTAEKLRAAERLVLTTEPVQLAKADFIVVSVPTPVDEAKRPDLNPLINASRMVGKHMKAGTVVVFESTVYPGATEEICIPELQQASGMQWKRDFHVAYSPERINPGDSTHTLENIVKLVAADDKETLDATARIYETIIDAGVYRVSGIQIAEAAKVIENTQRDLNIALVNELAIIFNQLNLDTVEVLEAAGTKWNFLPFRPGLVGGHCIGVDPYYLTHKAQMVGYHPQVILAGRHINDGMGKFIAEQTIKRLIQTDRHVKGAKVDVLGLTFKEHCPDLRNSQAVTLVDELASYGVDIYVHDPWVDKEAARTEYGINLVEWDNLPVADALVVAVSHKEFIEKPLSEYVEKLKPGGCFIDVKSAFDAQTLRQAGISVWRL